MDYLTVDISPTALDNARFRASEVYGAPRDIAMIEDRWTIGFLGEYIFSSIFDDAVPVEPGLEYDFVYHNKTIDVKSQKLNYPPRANLHFDIPEKEAHRKPDIYALVILSMDLTIGHLCGVISSKKFYKEASLLTKEALTKSKRGGTEPRYTLKLDRMAHPDRLKELAK